MRQKRDHADRAGKLRNLAKSNDRGTESLADGHPPRARDARARTIPRYTHGSTRRTDLLTLVVDRRRVVPFPLLKFSAIVACAFLS